MVHYLRKIGLEYFFLQMTFFQRTQGICSRLKLENKTCITYITSHIHTTYHMIPLMLFVALYKRNIGSHHGHISWVQHIFHIY
jgi:hypothetical protein